MLTTLKWIPWPTMTTPINQTTRTPQMMIWKMRQMIKIKVFYDDLGDWFVGNVTWYNRKMKKLRVHFTTDDSDDYISEDMINGVDIILVSYFMSYYVINSFLLEIFCSIFSYLSLYFWGESKNPILSSEKLRNF